MLLFAPGSLAWQICRNKFLHPRAHPHQVDVPDYNNADLLRHNLSSSKLQGHPLPPRASHSAAHKDPLACCCGRTSQAQKGQYTAVAREKSSLHPLHSLWQTQLKDFFFKPRKTHLNWGCKRHLKCESPWAGTGVEREGFNETQKQRRPEQGAGCPKTRQPTAKLSFCSAAEQKARVMTTTKLI